MSWREVGDIKKAIRDKGFSIEEKGGCCGDTSTHYTISRHGAVVYTVMAPTEGTRVVTLAHAAKLLGIESGANDE